MTSGNIFAQFRYMLNEIIFRIYFLKFLLRLGWRSRLFTQCRSTTLVMTIVGIISLQDEKVR
jgi:hypothetical protein